MRRYTFSGGTAVVTGAASGIGEGLAHALAARGSNLVLLDKDADRLERVVKEVRARHAAPEVTSYVVDLADAVATQRIAEQVRDEHRAMTLLVNNAGVALAGRFDEVTLDEFEWVVDINFHAAVRLTHVLLPVLKANRGSHLVNVSSLFGIVAPAGQTAYAASKFALRGFTEALRTELAENGVGVTSVHPGGIRTRISDSARIGSGVDAAEAEAGREQWRKLLTMDPAKAAEVIVDGVARRRGRVLISGNAKLLDVLARLSPAGYGRALAAITKLLAGKGTQR